MARYIKSTLYDAYMLESFRIGHNANEVWEVIKGKEELKNREPIITRRTVYNRYYQWVKDGRQGEMVSEKSYGENGEIIIVWRLKQKG